MGEIETKDKENKAKQDFEHESNWVGIQDRISREEYETLWETNCDKLVALWVEYDSVWEKDVNTYDIDFKIVTKLQEQLWNLTFFIVWSLFDKKQKYQKIDWPRVKKCKDLGIKLISGDIILNNSQIDLQMLSDFKDMGVSLWEIDEDKVEVLSKMLKSDIAKENIQKMLNELDIKLRIDDIAKYSKLFLSSDINWKPLKIIHQQWWKLYPWMINILNTKQLYPKRWEMLQWWVKFDEMVKYNDMSLEEFLEKTKLIHEMDKK